ncbi:D-isomer specific 2-hydroxyacid dehydrogenase [Lecanosticta acicola]|uniref:D-isomer specific 2-hydroxyacid dehydrogenase n=1 Tax=Lecanosticta acicola TaxID=111012 RepID=A0AAI8YUQ2_9PEZI|nr:D-isomer specific 2-hydroxyacid dehydrogenase [Lecanosticta acicola]
MNHPESKKPTVLHLGEEIKYNHAFYQNDFLPRFDVVRSEAPDRASFIRDLQSGKYGDFSAIFRPHFQSGGEMGQWDDELIALLPASVRIFASAGAGYNWADVDALGKRGIYYANGAGASDEAVADTALYMILSVFRNFTRSQLAARTCDGAVFQATHRLIATISANPKAHVLGLVGFGRIAQRVACKAKRALDMSIHYFDVVRASEEEERRVQATYHSSVESLLGVADCVSLHTPLNEHTRDLINASTLSQMRRGSRLINTARGQVVNEEALIAALETGHISAAALDVHYHEPHVSPRLAKMENVTLTTHIGGGALETRVNFELLAMKNILAAVGPNGEFGGRPLTAVNLATFDAA